MKTIRQQAIEFVKKLDDEVLKNMLISSHTSTTHQWMQVYPDGSVSKTEEADNNTRHYVSYPDKEVANIYNISNANCGCNCDICTLYNHFESLTKEEFLDIHNEDDFDYCNTYTREEAIYDYCTENGAYPEDIREQMLYAINEIEYGYFEDEKQFSITAAGENSIFVWSSPFAKNFNEMPEITDDMIVVITNAQHTHVTIYDVKGFSDEDIMEAVKRHCSYISQGCNYKYKFIKKIGNCYFVN